jgi:hypothetical protein
MGVGGGVGVYGAGVGPAGEGVGVGVTGAVAVGVAVSVAIATGTAVVGVVGDVGAGRRVSMMAVATASSPIVTSPSAMAVHDTPCLGGAAGGGTVGLRGISRTSTASSVTGASGAAAT